MKYCFGWVRIVGLAGLFISHVYAQRSATILDHKDRIRVKRMDILNSVHRETNLSITPDGRYLFFMSLRGGQFWSSMYMTWHGDSVYDGDVWYSEKKNGAWQKPRVLPYGINSESGEDEPNISPDGSTVYFQSWNDHYRFNGGPYYKSRRNGQEWGEPVGMGGGVSEFFQIYRATDGMSISPDQKTFVVAAGMEYDQNMDLFISRKNNDEWSYCTRLSISTPGDERSVFLSGDGKTLYFASDGYKGFGGLDIFKAIIQPDGSLGEVINLGEPFNTPQDDYGFILTGDGRESYFIRDGDIYFADLTEADERIKPEGTPNPEYIITTLAGNVKDKQSQKPIKAQILLLDGQTHLPVKNVFTQSNGQYVVNIPNKTGNYIEIVSAEGYTKQTRTIAIDRQSKSTTFRQNFYLEADVPVIADTGNTIVKPTPVPETLTPPNDPIKVPPAKPTSETDFTNIAPNHTILLLDVSESMNSDNRIALLKSSLSKILNYLRDIDKISVIVYSGKVATPLEAVSATEKDKISKVINGLSSGGSTLSKVGLQTAYLLAARNFIKGGNNRIIMATDGEFSITPLFDLAEANSKRQVRLSIFSFGNTNSKDLGILAQKGGGNFVQIRQDNIEQALLNELKAVLKR